METLLRGLCTKHWAVATVCVLGLVVYGIFDLYVSWSKPAVDLSGIERRLDRIEAKLLQPQQSRQLSQEEEAVLDQAHQLIATIFDIDRLEKKLAIPAY